MPWNAKCMTFGVVSHLHFEKTRELTGIKSPSSIMSLPWASPFCPQDHQTAAVSRRGWVLCSCLSVSECSPPASLNCVCGKLALDTGRVSALRTYLGISSAGGVWNTRLWSVRCLCKLQQQTRRLGLSSQGWGVSGISQVLSLWSTFDF